MRTQNTIEGQASKRLFFISQYIGFILHSNQSGRASPQSFSPGHLDGDQQRCLKIDLHLAHARNAILMHCQLQ